MNAYKFTGIINEFSYIAAPHDASFHQTLYIIQNKFSMSVKEMKGYLAERGVDFSDCFEKSDLRKRIEAVLRGEIAVKEVAKAVSSSFLLCTTHFL